MMKYLWPILLLISIHAVTAQVKDNRHCGWVQPGNIIIDDGTVPDPSSFSIKNSTDSTLAFEFNYSTGSVIVKSQFKLPDSVLLCYRILDINQKKHFSKSMGIYDSTAKFKDYGIAQTPIAIKKDQLFETGDVNTMGRLTRGFTVGSNQNVFMNSSLNLIMDGKLSDNLNIQATINDQNIPFQPEGNTLQLQEIDRVFLKLYNDDFSITGGDVAFTNRDTRFLKFNKNVQGANFLVSKLESSTSIGAAVAKGKFATVSIEALEGITGPYRIQGPEEQDFVVVLANSEKVYLDGNLLRRGFDNDYIIDYNLGEITFTSNISITKFSRIRVDYEFADNRYSRFILSAGHQQKIGRFSLSVDAYSEKDNKNNANFDLTNEDKEILSNVGDDLEKAVKSGADSVGFSQERILYKKILLNGFEIFKHSNNPDSAVWEVRFSNVGQGNGDYRQIVSTANGRVYEWVPPVNGIPQGKYVPYTIIPAPSKKQMVEIGGNYSISDHESISTQLSFSSTDINLFSDIDNFNNNGKALNFTFKTKDRQIGNAGYKLKAFTGLEYLDKYFSPIDRFRRVEFDRDWSVQDVEIDTAVADILINTGIAFEKDVLNLFSYGLSKRQKPGYVDGLQHNVQLNKELGGARFISTAFFSNNDQDTSDASWRKIHTDLSYDISGWRPGYKFGIEENTVSMSDSITFSANYFDEHVFYLRKENLEKSYFDINYRIRDTKSPLEGEMVESNSSQTLSMVYSNQFSTSQNISTTLTFRELQNKNENIDFGSGNSLTGRIDWFGSFFGQIIRNDLTWSISNSRELKKEYVFIEVPTGQGNYTWIDGNGDGVKDLNEFFLAVNIDERNFAKFFIPTSEYIDAFENTFNYRFNLRFPRSWLKSGGMKSLISRFSNTTVWTAVSRITDESISSRLFAFVKSIDRSEILSMRENFRTTMFFNRGNSKYGINSGYRQTRNLNLLTGGFEDRMIREFDFIGRVNIGRPYSLKISSRYGTESSESDFLDNRNFIIDAKMIRPSFTWQPKPNFRLNLGYGIRNRENITIVELGSERAKINEITAEVKVSKVSKTNLQGSLTFSNVDFVGTANSPAGYAVLAGLYPGSNVNWRINWQQTLINGLQMSVFYNGRKGDQTPVIHSGSISVSALF